MKRTRRENKVERAIGQRKGMKVSRGRWQDGILVGLGQRMVVMCAGPLKNGGVDVCVKEGVNFGGC